jgi:hypothetical protein
VSDGFGENANRTGIGNHARKIGNRRLSGKRAGLWDSIDLIGECGEPAGTRTQDHLIKSQIFGDKTGSNRTDLLSHRPVFIDLCTRRDATEFRNIAPFCVPAVSPNAAGRSRRENGDTKMEIITQKHIDTLSIPAPPRRPALVMCSWVHNRQEQKCSKN